VGDDVGAVIWRVEQLPSGASPATRKLTPESVSQVREGTPKRLSRRLRGDLDNIILMALRKEPQRRYATAGHLIDDLDNYLANLPVKARRDSLLYRSQKLVRRHAIGFTAAALVLLSAVAGAIGIARQAQIAARERDQAVAAQAQSEAVVTFLEEMLTSVRPRNDGPDVAVRDVLDQAAVRIQTQLDVQPAVKAYLYFTIGSSYAALGLYDEAEPHLRRSLEMRRAELGPDHVAIAESLSGLGNLAFATGRLDQAEKFHDQALHIFVAHFGQDHPATIATKLDLADVLGEHRDVARAEQILREVLDTRRRLCGPTSAEVAQTLNQLAEVTLERGNYAEAVRLLEEALQIHRSLAPAGHPVLMQSLVSLAGALELNGDHARAKELCAEVEPYLRMALNMHRGALGDQHIMTLNLLNTLAELVYTMDRTDEAYELFNRALSISTEMIKNSPEVSDRARNNHASLQVSVAAVLIDLGKPDQAEALLQKALATRRTQFGPVNLDVAEVLDHLANAALQQGDTHRGRTVLEEALTIRRELLDEDHPLLAKTSAKIAEIPEVNTSLAP
jgi:tetratricopeptide (TPR) repeat protein